MGNVSESFDRAVHSDFLIHWTGRDLDQEHHLCWDSHYRSITDESVTNLYVRRLQDILTYGLWMTEEIETPFKVGDSDIEIPTVPQCCFTELKLSESRRHAKRYGRLGIGVKRPYLFDRFGRPVVYFGYAKDNSEDIFVETIFRDLEDKRFMRFVKPMNSKVKNYDLYSESEWRILMFNRFLKDGRIKDPRDKSNTKEHEYFRSLSLKQQEKLKYLIPLDRWFSMIIYPSVDVKNLSHRRDKCSIISEIERIKAKGENHCNVRGAYEPVGAGWPIELDLDACRNF